MAPNPEDRINTSDNSGRGSERDSDSDIDLDFEPVKIPSKSGGRNWGLLVASIVILAIVGGGGWFIYGSQYQSPNQKVVPLIRAEVTPIKIKPAEPGGAEIPDRDKLVYNRLKGEGAGTEVEQLLPPPEEILDKPEMVTPETQPPSMEDVAETVIAEVAEPVSLEPVTLEPVSPEAVDLAEIIEEVVAPPPPPAPVPEVVAEPVAEPVPTPELVAIPEPTVSVTEPEVAAIDTSVPKVSTSDATSDASDEKAYRIQLAALRTEESAQSEWKRLKKRFPDVLGDLNLNVVRADLGEDKGIYYRLRAGPLASKESAKLACDKLSKLNQGCLVIRPGK